MNIRGGEYDDKCYLDCGRCCDAPGGGRVRRVRADV